MKHYLIYKTTCNNTGKFYIGMHETRKIEDGYLGSGIKLRASIKKYGKENHTRKILYILDSREDMIAKEIEIITRDLIKDPLCMNLKEGGYGGSTICSEETRRKISEQSKGRPGRPHTEEHKQSMRGKKRPPTSEETKRKISKAHMGKTGHNKGVKTGKPSHNAGAMLVTNGIVTTYKYEGDCLEGWTIAKQTKEEYNKKRAAYFRAYRKKKREVTLQ